MENLKQKTIKGLTWSFIDTFAKYGLTFFISIILARLLSPADFGLIGMTTIFFAISQAFVDGGFSSALIRKQDVTDVELSSVFYFNILIGIFFFFLLYITANSISIFFDEPKLTNIIKVIAAGLLIGSLSAIQQTLLTKRIDFKLQTKISVISTICSGVVAIIMAFNGFGVWSLVFGSLLSQLVTTTLLWLWNSWRPKLTFKWEALSGLFSFGSKLLVSRLINVGFSNIYYLAIGKYFSAADLGYFTRADNFKKLPSETITTIIQRVTYPVLATIQDDPKQLKAAYRKLIRSTMFISFTLMIGMAASAEAMVLALIGEKWLPSVIYLQMLCFIGMQYPLHAINLNMLNVLGRSDLFLKLEIIKKTMVVPVVIIGILFGIKIMIVGMMVNSVISFFLNTYWSGKKIGYSSGAQIADIAPSFLFAFGMGAFIFFVGLFVPASPIIIFIIQIITGAIFILVFGETIRLNDYVLMKDTVIEQIGKYRKK